MLHAQELWPFRKTEHQLHQVRQVHVNPDPLLHLTLWTLGLKSVKCYVARTRALALLKL